MKLANEKIKAFEILLESKDNAISDLKKKYSNLHKKLENYKELVKEHNSLKAFYKEKTNELEKEISPVENDVSDSTGINWKGRIRCF